MANPEYVWNSSTRLYESETGAKITRSALRGIVQEFLENVIISSDDLVDRLVKEPNVAAFELEMRDLIKRAHGAAGSIGRGGWKQMRPTDWGHVGNTVRREYEFLAEWGREIEGDLAAGREHNFNRLRGYMRMYIRDAFSSFANMLRRIDAESGEFSLERRRLTLGKKHCKPCEAYKALGWVPLGTLPDIGDDCDCLSNCYCFFEFM